MLREAEAGSPIKAVCAAHNISTATYHAWDANHDSDTDREAANCLECFFHGMRRVIGKYYGHEQGSGEARPTSAELARELLGPKGEKLRGDYSTVNSAQRVSATLSIRPSGRVKIIDM